MIRNLKAEELVGLIDALKGLLDDYEHELRAAGADHTGASKRIGWAAQEDDE